MMARPNVIEFEKLLSELADGIEKTREAARREKKDVEHEVAELVREHDELLDSFFGNLTPWDNVLLARHPSRPYTMDYLSHLADDWLELKGDRLFGDDGALVGGFARVESQDILLIGQQKGRDLKERQKRNFGYMRPEGYRKALRLMQTAAKFDKPVVTLVDTPGADPNLGSEERGISESIARNLREMSILPTPIVSVIIGEGGSGGALGIAVADVVLMMEHSIYSVIAPEGCASILWRDAAKGAEAAKAMRVTAHDALDLGLIDGVLPEPLGGAHRDLETTARTLKDALLTHLNDLSALDTAELLRRRHHKWMKMGQFS